MPLSPTKTHTSFNLVYNLFFLNTSKTVLKWWVCSSGVLKYISISSLNATKNRSKYSLKILFIRSINTVGISKHKRHLHVLIMSMSSVEGNLGYVLLLDMEFMVARPKVYFGKSSRTLKLVKKVMYQGQRVTVLDGYLVKLSVIYG